MPEFSKSEPMTPAEIALVSLASEVDRVARLELDRVQHERIRSIARSHGVADTEPMQLRQDGDNWFVEFGPCG
jgi:hypothetical protein